jgi:phosphatidylserine decarboxylase
VSRLHLRFAPGVRRFAAPPLAAAAVLLFVSPPLAFAAVLVSVGVFAFFRDPDRAPPESGVVSPADGRVSVVRDEDDGRVRVGVFMNVTDVHVNRAPMDGFVELVEHTPGGHWPAFSKESDRNERVRVQFGRHEVVLIAGAFARRITPYVESGRTVERGDRIGHIAFGSRADVVLPPEYDLADVRVETGDRVRAGETVVARRSGRRVRADHPETH